MRWKYTAIIFRGRSGWLSSKGILLALQCLACMAVAWTLSQCFWWLAAPGSSARPAGALPTLAEQGRRVAARHFFGAADASHPTGTDGAPAPQSAPEPRWRLLGTYVDLGGRSRALLTQEGQSETVLAQVGDLLPSGQEVAQVQAERVLLSRGSQRSEVVLRPAGQGEPGQVPLEHRWGATGPGPSARSDPFNKDSR